MKPGEECSLTVRVRPGAPRDEVVGFDGEVLRVKVRARPQEGQANAAMLRLLADTLGVRMSDLRLVRGRASRTKIVIVLGVGDAEVRRRIAG